MIRSKGAEETTRSQEEAVASLNQPYLNRYFVLNLLAFYFVAFGTTLDWSGLEAIGKYVINSIIAGTLCGILTLVFNGLLSIDLTNTLVFWKLRNPLPGCRAFSQYVHSDHRINPNELLNKLKGKYHISQFPMDPVEQNSLWYRIYKRHAAAAPIRELLRRYTLTRDLTALSAIFFIFYTPAALITMNNISLRNWYILILFILYFILSQAARNYGRRFVAAVLAEEFSSES